MKIKILGREYEVEFIDEPNGLDTRYGGRVFFRTEEIKILNQLTDRLKNIGILHEIIHVIDDATGMELEENQVKILAELLYSVLKVNNIVIDFLNNKKGI